MSPTVDRTKDLEVCRRPIFSSVESAEMPHNSLIEMSNREKSTTVFFLFGGEGGGRAWRCCYNQPQTTIVSVPALMMWYEPLRDWTKCQNGVWKHTHHPLQEATRWAHRVSDKSHNRLFLLVIQLYCDDSSREMHTRLCRQAECLWGLMLDCCNFNPKKCGHIFH